MSTESLNELNCSGIPQHRLVLKIGVPVMLLRNIDQSNGLYNGLNMSPNNDTLPIRFTRRQFPVALCFAITINKSQGQMLSTVGMYLPRPIFTHGHLYVVLSRVSMHSRMKILSVGSNGTVSDHTINVVYREVFTGLLSNILP
ncbi:ATP-dependent DNA helicase PIF1-like [Arachis ipaensis]|uniref:ATP-dependent DNA helicase PIF1-like n=1 Tax=Arachis ipaensis TaxID=130454 RepID=UPI0007AF3F63|nr:ATP-dependent DNA helicase PIF1-like [Arachis ipaensis]